MNFLAFDDIRIEEEGEVINLSSIIVVVIEGDKFIFPFFSKISDDFFLVNISTDYSEM